MWARSRKSGCFFEVRGKREHTSPRSVRTAPAGCELWTASVPIFVLCLFLSWQARRLLRNEMFICQCVLSIKSGCSPEVRAKGKHTSPRSVPTAPTVRLRRASVPVLVLCLFLG
jgi:hypothetical protein